ncbi:hypothetical protein [Pseudarthrobacter sp. NPDC058119]|uniref:hypothetical protein n=1 Tax=Pseudarthrobacter sp. NPDC058119 TaxID=3346348 RepID=UPI0036DEA979
MGESQLDGALSAFELSGTAWALTVHKAAGSSEDLQAAYRGSAGAQTVETLDLDTLETAEAELRGAGIADESGAISQQWILAAWISAFAPLRAAAVVQSAKDSVHTELAIAGGKGVAVTYARRIRHGQGVEVIQVSNAVEVCFFTEENAWAALNRHLPCTAKTSGCHQPSTETASNGSVADARYTIHLEVAAHQAGLSPVPMPGGPGPDHVSKDAWILTDRLHSLRASVSSAGFALIPVSRGDIGQTFAWRLLGAREFLASAAAQVA